MRELWRGDRVDFDGDYYKLRGHRSTTSRTAEYLFTWPAAPSSRNTPGGRRRDSSAPKARAELYADQLIPAVREGAVAAGRSVDDIDKMIEIKISYDPNPELALNNTRFWAPLFIDG